MKANKETNQEILTKAIQKAEERGCEFLQHEYGVVDNRLVFSHGEIWHPNDYIFNHLFAKALWGYGEVDFSNTNNAGEVEHIVPWQYHLQQMVLASDPIKYLGEHLDD